MIPCGRVLCFNFFRRGNDIRPKFLVTYVLLCTLLFLVMTSTSLFPESSRVINNQLI